VFYPGEIEHLKQRERAAKGIEVEDATWGKLVELARGYGVAGKLGL
jgi:uncharacterized oxidoreductase